MTNSISRFSNRVANYVKHRPGYPKQVLELFRDEMGLTASSLIADIGSGTGLSAELFLENGNAVYGVEPNEAMRKAAEQYLKEFPNFRSIYGTAEDTGLPSGSMDFAIAAQAFHWFDVDRARREFARILKPGGFVLLMWNTRRLDTTGLLRDYEALLQKFGTDYTKVRHDAINEAAFRSFFTNGYERIVLPNQQTFDFAGLQGRLLSSSYTPTTSDPRHEPMLAELRRIFEQHQEEGIVRFDYDTELYLGQTK